MRYGARSRCDVLSTDNRGVNVLYCSFGEGYCREGKKYNIQ